MAGFIGGGTYLDALKDERAAERAKYPGSLTPADLFVSPLTVATPSKPDDYSFAGAMARGWAFLFPPAAPGARYPDVSFAGAVARGAGVAGSAVGSAACSALPKALRAVTPGCGPNAGLWLLGGIFGLVLVLKK